MPFRHVEDAMLFPAPVLSDDWLARRAAAIGATVIRPVAEDGTRLYGWHLPARGQGVVLWFDGNGVSVGQRVDELRMLVAAGWDVLHVNYRGYPGSEGRPSEAGLAMDARAVWEWAGKVAPRRVIYGKSLGGGVAVALAATVSAQALVLESTFTSITDLARGVFAGFPVDLLMRNRFDSRSRLGAVRCPVLILHGEDDELIPARHARILAEELRDRPPSEGGPARLELFPGLGHNDAMLLEPRGREALMATIGLPGAPLG